MLIMFTITRFKGLHCIECGSYELVINAIFKLQHNEILSSIIRY